MLRHAIHLGNRLTYLIDTPALFIRSRGYLAHDVGHTGHGAHNFRHRFTRFMHQRRTGIHPIPRVINQRLNLFRRLSATLCQCTDLASDHGKPAPLLARTRRFYCRVQRQNIGLEGNAVDNIGNLRDFAGTGGNFIHRTHYAINHGSAFLRRL